MTTFRLRRAAAVTKRVGQQEWTTPGTYQYVVPMGVYSISAVAVGGGGSGGGSEINGNLPGYGAYGGSNRWGRDIPVTPGEILTIVVGDRGPTQTRGVRFDTAGFTTKILRGSTVLLSAAGGGRPSSESSTIGTVNGVTIGWGDGGSGQTGSGDNGGAAGGAGGYSGRGGGLAGSAAGGGGGAGFKGTDSSNPVPGGGGGGVGIRGEGASGADATSSASRGGRGGSGGDNAQQSVGGLYGGGGGGDPALPGAGTVGNPGEHGAARIIHGKGRFYPSTRTADEFP